MTPSASERLYQLLPSIYRIRDAEQGYPARALLTVLGEQLGAIESDIDRLYENWFIETCEPWVLPYIAGLLGIDKLPTVNSPDFNPRTFVANTLANRRRKGTPGVLGQLARDVSGWPVRQVELFRLVSTTQHLRHARPANVRTPDVRKRAALEPIDSAFVTVPRTADVRSIQSPLGRGRYNLPNVGIFAWRLRAYASGPQPAGEVLEQNRNPIPGFYTFDSLGISTPLFNYARPLSARYANPQESDVPTPLRPSVLRDELDAIRKASAAGSPNPAATSKYFGPNPVLTVSYFGGTRVGWVQALPQTFRIADLSNSNEPPVKSPQDPNDLTYIDPTLGRIYYSGANPPPAAQVRVSYYYGFSADLGGGTYDRSASLAPFDPQTELRYEVPTTGSTDLDSLAFTNTNQWIQDAAQKKLSLKRVVIELADNRAYTWTAIRTLPNMQLEVRAANGCFPILNVLYVCLNDGDSLAMNGLLIPQGVGLSLGFGAAKKVTASLDFQHCTLGAVSSEATHGLSESAGQPGYSYLFRVSLRRCISGIIHMPATTSGAGASLTSYGSDVTVEDSIVTAPLPAAPLESSAPSAAEFLSQSQALAGDRLTVNRSTILGRTSATSFDAASDSLFLGSVIVINQQQGCIRYSYVPPDSSTPPRYRCQPDMAMGEATDPAQQALVATRMQPTLTSVNYADPGFAQLALTTDPGIRRGASGGSEMGVYYELYQAQREANMRDSLDEYLRLGYTAGIFFES